MVGTPSASIDPRLHAALVIPMHRDFGRYFYGRTIFQERMKLPIAECICQRHRGLWKDGLAIEHLHFVNVSRFTDIEPEHRHPAACRLRQHFR